MIVLLPNCTFLSETSRMLAIARALEARGEPVTVASHGGPYEHLLDEAGMPWRRVAPATTADESAAFLEGVLSLGPNPKPLYPAEFARAAARAEADLFREVGARLAVIGFNLTTYFSSRLASIPVATSHGGSYVPPVLERGLCPVSVNPPLPSLGKLPRFARRWLANRVPRWIKAPADLNRIACELGVPPLPSFMAMMCGDLTLVTDVPDVVGVPREDLESFRPWQGKLWPTTTFRYTGPLFAELERPTPERVERFLRADGPVVYLAPTSVREPFLRELIAAVSAAGARVLVAATIHDVGDLETDRVMIEGVLPNHVIMKQVAACVIMGGQGSVQTAMACGTPFVGMPYHGEQELNVHLAEQHGMAIRLSPKLGGSEQMTAAVRTLLTDGSFRANAERVKQLYAGIDGADGAALAIIEFLAARGAGARAQQGVVRGGSSAAAVASP